MSCTGSLLYLVEKDECFHQQGIWPTIGPYFMKNSLLSSQQIVFYNLFSYNDWQKLMDNHLKAFIFNAQQGEVVCLHMGLCCHFEHCGTGEEFGFPEICVVLP